MPPIASDLPGGDWKDTPIGVETSLW